LIGWFVAVAGVSGYCEMNNKYNGNFLLTKVALNNAIDSIIISGAYKYGEDEEFIAIIDATKHYHFYVSQFLLNNDDIDVYKRSYERFPQYLPPTADMLFVASIPPTVNYPYTRLNQFVKKSQHTTIYFKYIMNRMMDMCLQYIILFLIIILESIIIVYAFVKYKNIAWAQSLCIFFVVGQFITIIIGGIGSAYDRLLLASSPFIIQIITSFLGILISFFKKEKLSESGIPST
jgi:hypothetical protein